MLVGLYLCLSAQADDTAAQAAFNGRIHRMEAAVAHVHDAVYTFHQKEVIDGDQQPYQQMSVKFRRPHDLYMKWVGEVNTGRQLIYREGWNDGLMVVDPGPWIPTLNLNPTGALATRGQRNRIYQMGPVAVARVFSADTARIESDPVRFDPHVSDHGVSVEYGEPVHCFSSELPKQVDPAFYAAKVKVCFSEVTDLPVRIQAWDYEVGKLMMVEDYGYANTKLNVGLTDFDFDPDNPAYGF